MVRVEREPSMRWTAILSILAILVLLGGCGRRSRTKVPETRPGDFSVMLQSEGYPAPAPDLRIMLHSDGTGTYFAAFEPPHPGQAQGPFKATPAQVDAVYAAVLEAEFFKLDDEYISDPPVPTRGIDTLVVTSGGIRREVRSEYSEVERVDLVRAAVMKVVPEEAYAGNSMTGVSTEFIVDKTTKLIYSASSPEVENIPEENRIKFKNVYEALNKGYHLSPGLRDSRQ